MMSAAIRRSTLACIAVGVALLAPAEPAAADDTAAPSAAAASPKPDWSWRLAGVVVTPDRRQALFMRTGDADTAERRTVETGQQIDGWVLSEIRPGGVTLASGGAEKRLDLQAQSIAERVLAAEQKQSQDTQLGEALLATATKAMLESEPARRLPIGK